MMGTARPHEDPTCVCVDCRWWDRCAADAPLTRCGETHVRQTLHPCQHGYTWYCPSFGISPRLPASHP